MSGGNYQGRQSMMLDTNQRLPQHNVDHVSVRAYKEIGDAPEHVSFAFHHQAACWMPIKATLHDTKCFFDLQGPIISWVHQRHTLYGLEDIVNRQPPDCQSTMINMNNQLVPTYRMSEVNQYE